MSPIVHVILVGSIVVLVVGGFVLEMKVLGPRRRKAFAAAARTAGCRYDEDGGFFVHQGPGALPLFRKGDLPSFRHLVRPDDDRDLALFLFSCKEFGAPIGGDHRGRAIVERVVIAIKRPDLWPQFQMRPEGILDRMGQAALGLTDFDFPENPAFSDRYILKGADERAIREIFRPEVLAFFEDEPGWLVDADRLWLIAYRERTRFSPGTLPGLVQKARRLKAAFA